MIGMDTFVFSEEASPSTQLEEEQPSTEALPLLLTRSTNSVGTASSQAENAPLDCDSDCMIDQPDLADLTDLDDLWEVIAETEGFLPEEKLRRPRSEQYASNSSTDAYSVEHVSSQGSEVGEPTNQWPLPESPVDPDVTRLPAFFLQPLGREVIEFWKWVQLTPAEVLERKMALQFLKEVIADLWPLAYVSVFGSWASGLSLPWSDIDCLIQGVPIRGMDALVALQKALRREHTAEVQVIASAKVPIIKFMHVPTGVWIDVSFCPAHSLQSANLAKELLLKYPIAEPLALVLRVLLHQYNLDCPYRGGLGSYGVLLMTVSYLRIAQHSTGTDIAAAEDVAQNLLQLLLFVGSAAPIQAFAAHREVPALLPKAHKGRMEIIDPLDQLNNVGYCCTRLQEVSDCCMRSWEALMGETDRYSPRPLSRAISMLSEGFRKRRLRHPKLFSRQALSGLSSNNEASSDSGINGEKVSNAPSKSLNGTTTYKTPHAKFDSAAALGGVAQEAGLPLQEHPHAPLNDRRWHADRQRHPVRHSSDYSSNLPPRLRD
eukprot:NODE_804_length_2074_cov_79.589954_g765_i0.p1 GENE.NODE_804_length_2074_cov_79.589954_g765_i0~~NODE_804_length_2074_cov_79.589954_g765_i0.p1  ORF type:complete len:571 (-),score=88.56 NODE_804_length_2074_cov_79.589954_g765_i0:362-1996(-)